MMAPGTDVKLDVFRGGKTENVTVKLGDQPANMGQNGPGEEQEGPTREDGQAGTPRLGVGLDDLTPDIARQLGLPRDQKGAVITRIIPGSPASRAGLMPGMVITKIGDQNVGSADEAVAAIKKLDLKKGAALYVVGPGGGRFVFVKTEASKPEKSNGKSDKSSPKPDNEQ
jgi:serine protease Do